MRGLMFTEYLDFVESMGHAAVAEEVLIDLGSSVTGAYTAVGNYSFDEFAKIHGLLSSKLNTNSSDLARLFGHWLLDRFKALFPAYFEGVESGLDFLEKTGEHIHDEVRKLYPDSSPPDVFLERKGPNKCLLIYRSHRPLAPVAKGLTEACLENFGDAFQIYAEHSRDGETVFELRATG